MACFGRKKEDYTLLQVPPIYDVKRWIYNPMGIYLSPDWKQTTDYNSLEPVPPGSRVKPNEKIISFNWGSPNRWRKHSFFTNLYDLKSSCILDKSYGNNDYSCPNNLFILGVLRSEGTSQIPKNEVKGFSYLERSAKKGFPPGMYAYGLALLKRGKEQQKIGLIYLMLSAQYGYFLGKNYSTIYKVHTDIGESTHFIPNIPLELIDDPVTDFYKKKIKKYSGIFGNSEKVSKYEGLISEWQCQRNEYFLKYKKILNDETASLQKEKQDYENGKTYHPISKFLNEYGTAIHDDVKHYLTGDYWKDRCKTESDFKSDEVEFNYHLTTIMSECIDPDACPYKLLIMGLMHKRGSHNIESNTDTGLNYLKRSAEKGFPPGMYAYAMALEDSNPQKIKYLKRATESGYFCGNNYDGFLGSQYFYPVEKELYQIDDPVKDFYERQIKENSGIFGNPKKVAMYEDLISKWKPERDGYLLKYEKLRKDEILLLKEEKQKRKDEEKQREEEEDLRKYELEQKAKKAAAEQAERDDPDGSKRRQKARDEHSKKWWENHLPRIIDPPNTFD